MFQDGYGKPIYTFDLRDRLQSSDLRDPLRSSDLGDRIRSSDLQDPLRSSDLQDRLRSSDVLISKESGGRAQLNLNSQVNNPYLKSKLVAKGTVNEK